MNAPHDDFIMPGGGASITALPKVSLHDHLDGGLRPQTIIELADAIGMELPATDATALGTWFADQADSGSLVEYLTTFDVTTGVMQTQEGLTRVAREFVQDIAADDYRDPLSAQQSKQLMRMLLNHHLAGKTLHTRELIKDLQKL